MDNIKYDAAKSRKGAIKMNVDKTLYVGGLPPEKTSRLQGVRNNLLIDHFPYITTT